MPVAAKLSRRLHETLGDEAAEAMVDWMHRMESDRVELRELSDLSLARIDARFGEFTARMEAKFIAHEARVDARFVEFGARVDARFLEQTATYDAKLDRLESALRSEMNAEFAAVRQELSTGLAALEAKIDRRFADLLKWSFAFWVGSTVTLVLALATLQRLTK